jgi:hypothetical protein
MVNVLEIPNFFLSRKQIFGLLCVDENPRRTFLIQSPSNSYRVAMLHLRRCTHSRKKEGGQQVHQHASGDDHLSVMDDHVILMACA